MLLNVNSIHYTFNSADDTNSFRRPKCIHSYKNHHIVPTRNSIIRRITIPITDKNVYISKYILLNKGWRARWSWRSPPRLLQWGNSSIGIGLFRNLQRGFQPSFIFITRSLLRGTFWNTDESTRYSCCFKCVCAVKRAYDVTGSE